MASVEGWQQSSEARGHINMLLARRKRKQPCILETCTLSDHFYDHPKLFYRLFLFGKSGVGKTSTVYKLCGRDICDYHEETLGIQTNTLLWPTKLVTSKKVVLLHLELWDAGDRAVKKYDHILPTCIEYTDGVMFFFSFIDRHSWEELPSMVDRVAVAGSIKLKIVVGTHADSARREVTQSEVLRFQEHTKIAVLPIANVKGKFLDDGKSLDGRAGIEDVTPFMSTVTEILIGFEKQRDSMNKSQHNIDSELQNSSPEQN